MITLEDLKDELNIDFNDHDRNLQRKLDAAIQCIQNYTDVYMIPVNKTFVSDGCETEIIGFPVSGIIATYNEKIVDIHVDSGYTTYVRAQRGALVSYTLGSSEYKNSAVEEAILRMAVYLFENADANPLVIPSDIQALVNQERRSTTI